MNGILSGIGLGMVLVGVAGAPAHAGQSTFDYSWEWVTPSQGGIDYGWYGHVYDLAYAGNAQIDEIQVHVWSSVDPVGIDVTFRETGGWAAGPDEGVFFPTNLVLMDGPNRWTTTERLGITLDWSGGLQYLDPNVVDTVSDYVWAQSTTSNASSDWGIIVSLTETGSNTGIFAAMVKLDPSITDQAAVQLQVSEGDVVSFGCIHCADKGYALSNGVILPISDPGVGAIEVEMTGVDPPGTLSASYNGATITGDIAPEFSVESGWQLSGRLIAIAPGDVNLDGTVDFGDAFVVLRHMHDCGASWTDGDMNEDGCVGVDDLFLVVSAIRHAQSAPPSNGKLGGFAPQRIAPDRYVRF